MPYRYGYMPREPQKRLTPKSQFLLRLERMQRAANAPPVEHWFEVPKKHKLHSVR